MIVECKTCGAPLDVVRGSAFAKCSYCGTTSKVKSARTLLAETPPGWAPPATWKPAPAPPRPVARPAVRGSGNAAGCVGPLVMVAIVVGVGAFAAYRSGALTGLPFLGLALDGAPSVATVDLAAIPSAPLRATADGDYAASSLGPACRGRLPRTPQFVLRTSTGAAVRVGARDTSGDLVMAIRTSDGRWLCDDDSGGGTQPLVTATLPAGDHRVFVGTFSSGGPSDFTLAIEAQTGVAITGRDAPAGLLPDAAPQIGAVQLGEAPLDGRWRGSASGWTQASTMRAGCPGHLPPAPHLRIVATIPREVELVTRDNASTDLVMLVQGADGTILCDDDSGGGLNPRVRTRLSPGATNVWVGVYHAENTATFELELDASSVDRVGAELALEPRQGTLSLDVPGGITRYEGRVSAERSLSGLDVACRGRTSRRPELVVLTSAPRAMTLSTQGDRGLRVIVRGPGGQTFCADDERGPATLRHTFEPGTSHVWIGTGGARTPRYTLTLEP